jgi:hypothetical protein
VTTAATSQVAAERARRYALHREATIPPCLALPTLSAPELARCLGLVADGVEPIDATTLRVRRVLFPAPVLLHLDTLDWQCEAGTVEGRGILELASYLRDRDLIGTAAMFRRVLGARGGRCA